MAGWEIHRFHRSYDRSAFDCGQPMLNDWLAKRVSQYEKKDLARAYVAVRAGENRIWGYYAISNHRISYEALPEDQLSGLPRVDVPVVMLGRLAVDLAAQGQRLGEFLLIDALRRAEHISQHIGVRAVEVEAIDGAAGKFYLKYGFVPLLDDPQHLFLPMRVIRKLRLPPLDG